MWESWVTNEIQQRKMALVSDKYYLDYFFNQKSMTHTSLYRSTDNTEVLPFFIPLSNTISEEIEYQSNKL